MHSTRMHTKRFAIAATTVALAAPALVVAAAPANAANIDLGTRTGDVVKYQSVSLYRAAVRPG